MEVLWQRGGSADRHQRRCGQSEGDDDFTPVPQHHGMNFTPRDTSRKIRSVFKSKGMSGKHLTGTVIYGYLWDEKGTLAGR